MAMKTQGNTVLQIQGVWLNDYYLNGVTLNHVRARNGQGGLSIKADKTLFKVEEASSQVEELRPRQEVRDAT